MRNKSQKSKIFWNSKKSLTFSSKSQFAVGQIFIYILAIIIAGLIILYGYRAIAGFRTKAEEIALINFKTSVENDIESIAGSYGSVRMQTYDLPSSAREVCFVNASAFRYPGAFNMPGYPIINNSVRSGSKQNIFLVPMAEIPISVENMEVNDTDEYLCINSTRGKITIRLEGLGNRTKIFKG